MLVFIDPIVYIVHAYEAREPNFHERHVRTERSIGWQQSAARYRDGECVCVVLPPS